MCINPRRPKSVNECILSTPSLIYLYTYTKLKEIIQKYARSTYLLNICYFTETFASKYLGALNHISILLYALQNSYLQLTSDDNDLVPEAAIVRHDEMGKSCGRCSWRCESRDGTEWWWVVSESSLYIWTPAPALYEQLPYVYDYRMVPDEEPSSGTRIASQMLKSFVWLSNMYHLVRHLLELLFWLLIIGLPSR